MTKLVYVYDTTAKVEHIDKDRDVIMIDRFDSTAHPDVPYVTEPCKIHTFCVKTIDERVADHYKRFGWTKSAVPKSESGLESAWRVEKHVVLCHELQELVDRFVDPLEVKVEMLESVRRQYIKKLEGRDRDVDTLKRRVLRLCNRQKEFLNAPWYKRVWIALTVNWE